MRAAQGLLDARRRRRAAAGEKLSWSLTDADAVATLLAYVKALEAEHPATSRLLRLDLDRKAT